MSTQPPTQQYIYEFDDFRVDTARRLLLQADRELTLTPRIFDALLYLVQHQGRVIPKEELMEAIWPNAFVEENNLPQSISALRRALGERRGENRYIVTVAGHGYRFAAPVKIVSIVSSANKEGSARAAKTVAVLPFKPLVEKHRDEALELGMADALIIRLSNSGEIIVRPLSSVRRYGGLEQDAQNAGRELGVESVLDGSIQRSGDGMRVTARLTNVADGAAVWVGTFDEKFTDVFTVQDAISERVADALRLRLSTEAQRGLTKRYTDNPAAYELYLQGRYHWSKLIPTEVRKGIQFFQQAIQLDANYALAYMGMAVAYVSLPISCDAPPQEAFPQAKAAALKALELDDSLSDAHAYLTLVKIWFDWDWNGAEQEIKRGLALSANSAEAHRVYGILLSQTGRYEEAITEGVRARELDPLALITRTNEALFFYYAGRYAEAEEKITRTLELEPNFWIALLTRAKIVFQLGKHDEAMAELIKARKFSGGSAHPLSMLGYISAITGDRTQALTILDELQTLSTQRYVPRYNFALVHNGLGNDDETFAWLDRAYEGRDVMLAAFINIEPVWDRLRGEERFKNLLRRMNLE
ncbi:MAG: winged helix-turn-helix domain-containing protein [Pyrinomonadaceae bacterium]|nr:winged helix-turn-helix domain-containing protein [Pyrinomonadaceae bacterium]